MPANDINDLRRQVEALLSRADAGDLQELARQLGSFTVGGFAGTGSGFGLARQRPRLHHDRRDEPATYRVRVDLDHAHPPIWRRLEVRSDLTLGSIHEILQDAYDWTDSHLHRFSMGSKAFDRNAEFFLCDWDVEEGEEGIPETEITLDQTLADPGDVLHYVYDYGDDWELTIRLEAVLPLGPNPARCVGGRRASPPEDSGGHSDAEDLGGALPAPAAFDMHGLNERLDFRFRSTT